MYAGFAVSSDGQEHKDPGIFGQLAPVSLIREKAIWDISTIFTQIMVLGHMVKADHTVPCYMAKFTENASHLIPLTVTDIIILAKSLCSV